MPTAFINTNKRTELKPSESDLNGFFIEASRHSKTLGRHGPSLGKSLIDAAQQRFEGINKAIRSSRFSEQWKLLDL
jgi:hypothetical protein